MEIKNGATILEKTLAVSYKVKHALNIRLRNSTPSYLPKRNG